jgi:RHS repeat-associated protein
MDGTLFPHRWPGQQEDCETGLCYNRFRYYDPQLGGYVSPDPSGILGGIRTYGYVHDTITWIDPFGLSSRCPVAQTSATGARFEVTEAGVAIPRQPAELRSNMSLLTDRSTEPAKSMKFVGQDSLGPVRVRIEKAHDNNPNFTGVPDPLHIVDHVHIDRRANGATGSWGSEEKVPYAWPF